MVRSNFKVSILLLVLYMVFLTVFPAQMIPFNVRFPIIVIFLVIGSFYVASKLKLKEILNEVFFCLIGVIILSVINWHKGNIALIDLVQCFIYYFGIILLYDIMKIFDKQGKGKELLKSVFGILAFYTVLNVVSVAFIGTDDLHNLMYLFGNKFRVSYYILYLIGLIYCLHSEKIRRNIATKGIFVAGSVLAMVYMYYITCKTGVVAVAFFLILALFLKRECKIMSNVYFILACTVVAGFIILGFESIIRVSFVQNIIRVLNEDMLLSGRTRIYSMYLFPLLSKAKWIGYGYGNTAMWTYSIAFANAQNGMFDYILNNGIIGLALHLVIMFVELRNSELSSKKHGLYLILFAMIIISVVEINYGAFMLLIVFLIRWYSPREVKPVKHLVG